MAYSYQKQGELTFADLKSLREKLAAKRRELDEQERALQVVENMLREKHEPAGPNSNNPPAPSGFSDAVRFVAATSFGKKEFTVADIESSMAEMAFQLPKTEPRGRIAMVVKEMLDNKQIERTFQGEGRTPHRYRSKS